MFFSSPRLPRTLPTRSLEAKAPRDLAELVEGVLYSPLHHARTSSRFRETNPNTESLVMLRVDVQTSSFDLRGKPSAS